MAKNISVLIIFALSLISILSFSCLAITEDFIALSDNAEISACQCSIVENSIKIGNTGNINSLYSISQSGKASAWSVIRPKSFSLEEKDIKTLINPINVPCDAKPGYYDLNTYIETGFGLKKVIQQTVAVKRCEVVSDEPETVDDTQEGSQPQVDDAPQDTEQEEPALIDTLDNIRVIVPRIKELCGCENKTYSYDVVLKSKEADTLKTYVEGLSWASIDSSAKYMEAGSELVLDLVLEPVCEELGKKSIKIVTESLNTSNKEEHIVEFELSREGECRKEGLFISVLKWIAYISAAIILIIIIVIVVLYASESGEEPSLDEDEEKLRKAVKRVKAVKKSGSASKPVKKSAKKAVKRSKK